MLIPRLAAGEEVSMSLPGLTDPVAAKVAQVAALWAVEGALLLGIGTILLFAFRPVARRFADGSKAAVGGALLAGMNTAVDYGFGAVIAALPGLLVVKEALRAVPDPLVNEAIKVPPLAGIPGVAAGGGGGVGGGRVGGRKTGLEYGVGGGAPALRGCVVGKGAVRGVPDRLVNEAVTVTSLAGITGSASGGLSIALAAMAEQFAAAGDAAGIPREVLHRVASMASGGMDSLPHNGAILTLLAVTGLTHRQAYKDIFSLTLIKTFTLFVVLSVLYLSGWKSKTPR